MRPEVFAAMSVLVVVGLAIFALAAAGVIYQSVGLACNARRFPPPGQLVDVGSCRLHIVCAGEGRPTVVLEAGIAASSLSWARVQPAVARFTRVCAYDRAGLAWSDASVAPRTLAHMVSELRVLLTRMDCAARCVLVGHSFGAFVSLAYAAAHPLDVDGLILVDPPSEWMSMNRRQTRLLRGGVELARLGALLARLGVVRACLALLTGGVPAAPRYFIKVFGPTVAHTLERLVGEVRKLPLETLPVVAALWCQPKCFRALADHLSALEDATVAVAQIGPLGDIPLVVISSGDQTPEVIASHRALSGQSSRGRHRTAPRSGHWVQYDEPKLIVDTIREVVDAGRQHPPTHVTHSL